MSLERAADIKNYICELFIKEDESLQMAKRNSEIKGLPRIAISENTGKLIYILTKLQKPKNILEIGTLGGYSTLWLAKAAPLAKIVTLESEPYHAEVARENFKNTKLSHQIELIENDAHITLAKFIEDKDIFFDLIFLDAEKEGYLDYLPFIVKLATPGALLITDNLIPREGAINEPPSYDYKAIKTYEFNALLASHPKIETILVPTITRDQGRLDALGLSIISG